MLNVAKAADGGGDMAHLAVLDCLPLARHELCKGARGNIMEA